MEQERKSPAAENQKDEREYVYIRYDDDDDDELDIYDIINLCKKGLLILKRYVALLLAALVLGGVLGYAKAKIYEDKEYTSEALLFVDLQREKFTSTDTNESSIISMLAYSYSEIVKSDRVMQPVVEKFALDEDETKELKSAISVYVPSGTQTIKVSVTYKDAAQAQEICEMMIDNGVSALETATDYASVNVVSPASTATVTTKTSGKQGAVKMAGIFLAAAICFVVLRELVLAYKRHEAAKPQEKKNG